MKILHIHTGLTLMGGAESVIINLSNEQVKTNDVRVCSIFKPADNGVFYTRFASNVKREHLGILSNGISIKNLWRVFKYISKNDAQIIHIHGFFYYYFLPILFFHNRFIFVYTVHSDAVMENSKWDKKIFCLKRFCFKHGWMNPVTISPESNESFTFLYNTESRIILNGVPQPLLVKGANLIDECRITSNTKVFVHPGRISPEKNQVVLCKVFNRLIREGEDVCLIIVGTKQVDEVFQKMKPYFCNRIKYMGERNDVSQLLSRADGLCLPSIWEGLPMTLLEALSVGCIPICSPVGGIVGVISTGENGMLSKSSSEEDYYDCMKFFLSFKSDRISLMKQKALKSFAPYNICNTANKYCDFYRELLNK